MAREPVRQFCSRTCASRQPRPNARRRKPVLPRTCPCGDSFTPKQESVRFCSRTCISRFGGRIRKVTCPSCAVLFETRVAIQIYCSSRCLVKARNLRRLRACERCGTEFRGADKRRRFCTRDCAYAHARTVRGANSVNWRGGRTISKGTGYVFARAEGHPRAKPKWPYVLEHILVMEQSIGRYLLPHERVHHKNGVRNDNRIENLELWKIKDPAGVRAVDYHCAGCVCDGQPVVLLSPGQSWTAASPV